MMDGTDRFATAKPNARLVKLLLRARRFNAVLTQGEGIAFAALAQREGVSPSYFTRLVRLSYLAPESPRRSSMGGSRAISRRKAPRALTPAACLARAADRARLWLSPVRAQRYRTIELGEGPDFIGTGAAFSPTT